MHLLLKRGRHAILPGQIAVAGHGCYWPYLDKNKSAKRSLPIKLTVLPAAMTTKRVLYSE